MKRFVLEQSESEFYTSHSGLALVGLCLNRYGEVERHLKGLPLRHGIRHADLVRSYVGLLCLGKSDFEAVEDFRQDGYFRQSLGIGQLPSAARLRQRFDETAEALLPLVWAMNVSMLDRAKVPITALETGHVPLDIDVYPMDNSGTKKEAVSRTYAGFDGYAPIAAYLGREGWCLTHELRPGSQHSQFEFGYVLERVLPAARRLVGDRRLLVRLDSAHDALETRVWLSQADKTDFILKWNPRKQDEQAWLAKAEAQGSWEQPRPGKRVCVFSQSIRQDHQGQTYPFRRVIRLTERTIDQHGQQLLVPEIELEGWWTNLSEADYDNRAIIELYQDHATCEQFHSEFKSDLDLERPPSGKFATNDLILTLAAVAYNILRWIGLIGLLGQMSPIRHPAKRRRLKTVIQELMYLAARLIHSGRRLILRFSKHCPAFPAFCHTYRRLAYG